MPSRKPSVRSWFKSFASGLFTTSKTLLVPKSACTGNTVENAVEVFETSEKDFDSSQIIETPIPTVPIQQSVSL